MTDSSQPPRLNVLTSPWIPLVGREGPASFVDLLCGDADGPDLAWPRDDFKVFTRLLLSALAQALFPAATVAELAARLKTPLPRALLEKRCAEVAGDFELLPEGRPGFLQAAPVPGKEDGAARFVFSGVDLFRPPVPVERVSLPTALVMLFAEQTYAGGAGRGYSTGPAGQPGVMTLVDPGTVRAAVWANTLPTASITKANEAEKPWSNEPTAPRLRGAIGLATGLFFQPRAIWLTGRGVGQCSFSGLSGPLVVLQGFQPKHGLAKEKQKSVWVHPCAPMELKSTGVAPVRLRGDRPAWTGLAQLLSPVSRQKKAKDPLEAASQVLDQWRTQPSLHQGRRARLILLDYDRDKAIIRRAFFEQFPLTDALHRSVERLRRLIEDTESVAEFLRRALVRAHDDQKRGGFSLNEALAEFWTESEPAFLSWLDAVGAENASDEAIENARAPMERATRKAATELFERHVSVSEWDARMQERIALARRSLRRSLYPKPTDGAVPATKTKEMTT